MKILNLYAGIGGNRKLWGDTHEIDAVEIDPEIAAIYKDFYPGDNVIIADAHQFLLDHYKEYEFIWSSPPCPTHSEIRRCGVKRGQYKNAKAEYPDMTLYQEIIFLMYFSECLWVVENVKPYYTPLIPGKQIERHLFWSNMVILAQKFEKPKQKNIGFMSGNDTIYGCNVSGYSLDITYKRKLLRNMVNPAIGKYILDIACGTSYKIDNLDIFSDD